MNNDLSILFSKDGFSFYVINNGDIIHQDTTLYTNPGVIEQEQPHVQKLTQEKALYWKQKYSNINVTLHSLQFNIIPQDIYSAYNEPEFWLEYNTEIFENDPIRITPLEYINAVLVFSFASEIQSSLEHFFENYKIQHSLVPLIKASQEHQGKRVYVNLFLNTLEVMVMDDDQLILYNIYNVHTKEDFSYYVLNAYKITNTNPVIAPLYYHGTNLEEYLKMLTNFISIANPLNLPL